MITGGDAGEPHTLERRVGILEKWRIERDIAEARAEEARKYLDARFNALETELKAMNDSLRWVVRLVIGGILAGVVSFLLRGGFTL